MNFFLLFIILIIAILADIVIIRVWRRYNQAKNESIQDGKIISRCNIMKQSFLNELNEYGFIMRIKKAFSFWGNWTTTKNNIITMLIVELGAIAIWAAIVGRPYLNFDPTIIPSGIEFSNNIQFHHTWIRALECSWCAAWNHSVAGGYPTFADLYGSTLHPVIIITTLLFGVLSGTKISLVITFFAAGVAQWWLAYELKLGRTARLWSAGLAVAAGHITGKMELGAFGMAFSIAMVSLIFASILAIHNGKGKKYTVILGILGASAILSGQGYIQAGFLGTAPAFLILLFDHRLKIRNVWKEYFLAIIIACLLAAPLIVPYLNFSENFKKNADFEFRATQPLKYIALNLVIDDWPYYTSDGVLGRGPFPAMDNIYIGWIPVILAIIGIFKIKPQDRSFCLYAASTIILVFLFASGTSLRWIVQLFEGVANIRFANHVAGLSVPLILGFSAYGLNYVLSLQWLTVQFSTEKAVILLTKLLLLIPLLISINGVYQFSKYSIKTYTLGEDVYQLLDSLKTNDAQWVSPPYGEQYYMEAAIASGLKISPGIMPWAWKGRETPKPFLEATREGGWEDYQFLRDVNGISIFKKPDELYAKIITHDGDFIPCSANGTGGTIQVYCESTMNGTLVVKENYFPGWKVQLNEKSTPLVKQKNWLAAHAPAGKNIFVFQYFPWDVPVGIGLSLLGCILCIFLLAKKNKTGTSF
jgi:hypothetical protein